MHFFQIKFTVSLFLSQFKTQKMCGVAILDSVGRPSLHSRIGWPDPSATQLKNTCGISRRMTGMVTNTIYLFFFSNTNLSWWHLTVVLKLRIRPRRSLWAQVMARNGQTSLSCAGLFLRLLYYGMYNFTKKVLRKQINCQTKLVILSQNFGVTARWKNWECWAGDQKLVCNFVSALRGSLDVRVIWFECWPQRRTLCWKGSFERSPHVSWIPSLYVKM